MSRVRSLCWWPMRSLDSVSARMLELMALYWLFRCRWPFRMVFSFLVALCAGELVLLTTGLMGIAGKLGKHRHYVNTHTELTMLHWFCYSVERHMRFVGFLLCS
jgi:hypothetical protein